MERYISYEEFNRLIDTNSILEAPQEHHEGFSLGHWDNHIVEVNKDLKIKNHHLIEKTIGFY